MTYDEYEKNINEVLGNPDTALANIAPVLEEIKKDTEALTSAMSENESLKTRIRDLQDTNMKLYLSQTGQAAEEVEAKEPATGTAVIDEFLSEVFGEDEEE